MSLPMRTETIHQVDYSDFEQFVNEAYGFEAETPFANSNYKEFPYSFVAVQEASNDSSYQFAVDGNVPDYDREALDEWIEKGGKGWIGNDAILNDLAWKGLIPKGNYIINVSW